MEQTTVISHRRPQIIYKSAVPDIKIPKHSVFEHILPTIDVHNGQSVALVDGLTGETVTRDLLRRHALTLAAAMVDSLGLREGEVIMILSPNSIQYPIVLLAALAAGLKVTFANPSYTSSELAHQLHDSHSACIFAHPDALSALRGALPRSFDAKKRVVLMPHTESIPTSALAEGWLLLDDLLANGPRARQIEPFAVDGEDAVNTTAFLYYSSGTTGKSKGVETTHHNMVSALEMSTGNWAAVKTGVDVMLAVIPWYHITGGCVTLLYPLHMAAPIVVLPAFQPKTFLSAIEQYRVSVMVVAPPILLFFQNSPLVEEYDLGSLAVILCGSAPASKALVLGAMDRLNQLGSPVAIGQAYGLTETSPAAHVTPPSWSRRKAGKVGRLQPNMEARLVDDAEVDVPRGERGELWVRGPNVMKGYLGNDEATRNAVTEDGWLKTGDIAIIDEDGFAQIVDRKKELIKFKGFQVPPAELEALLLQHPGIADAGVIGVFSHELQTELPRAYIVPRDVSLLTASAATHATQKIFSHSVAQWVQSQVVQYKRLRGGVVLVGQIPRSAAGKILRNELRKMAQEEMPPTRARL